MKWTTVFTFTALLAGATQVQAQQQSNFAELVARLDEHPAIEAARQAVLGQQEAAEGEMGLPDPMVQLGVMNYPADGSGGFDRFAMSGKTLGVVQKIPNGGGREASAEGKRQLAAKAKLVKMFTLQRLEAAFITAQAELKRIVTQRKLLEKDKNLLTQEGAYWDGRLEAGQNTLDERARVDADLAQVEASLATLEAEEATIRAELERLVESPVQVDIPIIIAHSWQGEVVDTYPVLMARKDIVAAQAGVDKAKSAFMPDYQVGLTYTQRDNSGAFDGGDFVSVKVGVSIPLWSHRNQAPKLRAAKAGMYQAKAQLDDVQRLWRQRLTALRAKVRESQATQVALQAKLKAIETRTQTLQTAYEADGRLDISIAAERSGLEVARQLAAVQARKISQIANFNSYFRKGESQ